MRTVEQSRIKLIYTGGTIGMVKNDNGNYVPFDLDNLMSHVPKIKELGIALNLVSFNKPVDSSQIQPSHWIDLVEIIEKDYDHYDGFVILHGTDTMAYSASALGFLLQGIDKPVIFTGSQLPISELRSDARDNLITALQFAKDAIVKEVAIAFNNELLRGVRSRKRNAEDFDAFESPNSEPLAVAGTRINYAKDVLKPQRELQFFKTINEKVILLKLHPGFNEEIYLKVLDSSNVSGIVLEVFGSGTVPFQESGHFVDQLIKFIQRGHPVIAVSQCPKGTVEYGKYEAGNLLAKIGVINGENMTSEAALTKMMVGLGNQLKTISSYLSANQVGEKD